MLDVEAPQQIVLRIGDLMASYLPNAASVGQGRIMNKSYWSNGCKTFDEIYLNGTQTASEGEHCFPSEMLYKVGATKFGLAAGQQVSFVGPVPNAGNIRSRQAGFVQGFGGPEELVNWWDALQRKLWAVPPSWLSANLTSLLAPKSGNGAWVGLHSVNAGIITISEKIGTTKTHERTTTDSWASEVTRTLSRSFKAGVGFLGLSAEVEVGSSLSESLRQEHINSQSYAWAMSQEEAFELELPPNSGYLWQWHIRTELENGEVYTSRTRNFALTAGLFQKPRCIPGYCLGGGQANVAACQVCYSEEATIQGLPPPFEAGTRVGAVAKIGLLIGALSFGLFP